ncbi:succinyl-diaminopimelate desuccinylase [Pseudoalteromonas sp. 2CM41L]|uniref:succinyl-diaminopimelate desuccinylase n=1 Tax=Pseudoalteromonas sp. 2CM41L TaxID=2929857 RepID=UPI0020BF3C16|nr:succinyl-diaminopimelate desuccinylase [Pseudoalteromonas sp. 2CM41L]MCK8108977.1 succinyl-diaminopimelate desuccinylase [Pseudoalteromonas sp. 2CM41L]
MAEPSQAKCLMLESALKYAEQLVSYESVTPNEAGCSTWLSSILNEMGADVDVFGSNGVTNIAACFNMGEGPNIAFCGHIDVVPALNMDKWFFPPFKLTSSNGQIYGRGIADMKGGIACALAALRSILDENHHLGGKFWFLITSDEEGEAEFGSKAIVEKLAKRNVTLDYCIIGEPTASYCSGDVFKVGRRGSLSFDLKITGKSGHVAYPQYGVNSIHLAHEVISNLKCLPWYKDNADCSDTSMQFTHIDSGKWSDNVIPNSISISFNIRYSDEYTKEELIKLVKEKIDEVTSEYDLRTYRHCESYLSKSIDDSQKCLLKTVEKTINKRGFKPNKSISGGTSDGRFFKHISSQVIELGLPNNTIHQENECVKISDMKDLSLIYKDLFETLWTQ